MGRSLDIEHLKQVCDLLIKATNTQGFKCREFIDEATAIMFGSDKIHDAAVYCLQILIWNMHAESAKREVIAATVRDYTHTSDSQVSQLLRSSTEGRTLNVETMFYMQAD